MRRRLLAAAGAAVVAVVAFGVLFSYPGPGVASGGEPACADLLVVGLRGNGDAPDAGHGMGGDAWAVASRLDGSPAPALYGFPYATGPWWRLGGHVRAAAGALAAFLRGRERRCPGERLVLIGQSEGAAVVHLTLPSVGPQLAAAILLADPLRIAGGSMDDLGRPPGGLLAPVLLGPLGGLGPPREVVPGGMAGRVRSYCLDGDPVCHATPGALLGRTRGDVHTTYRFNPDGIADRAADFARGRVTNG